jgi:hypothetical protein
MDFIKAVVQLWKREDHQKGIKKIKKKWTFAQMNRIG